MTRKEEVINKAVEFVNNRYCDIGIKTTHEASVAACQDIAEWADKTMIDKVCNFIRINAYKYRKIKFVKNKPTFDFRTDWLIEDLRKYMKGE
jgi:hypothetical protein